MGQVRITLNGRGYDIACDDGQEEHVMRLANALSERVNQLVTANGQVGEARLLLMAGLLMADDLFVDHRDLRLAFDTWRTDPMRLVGSMLRTVAVPPEMSRSASTSSSAC